MAYMSQERKKSIAPVVKALLKKHGLKGSLSVHHSSELVLTIKEGEIDFIKNANDNIDPYSNSAYEVSTYIQVNQYHISRGFSGEAEKALVELYKAMMNGNHNNNDIQSDYFDVGWYISINVGKWDAPYKLVA
jgi:hypothetical protein